MQSTPALNIKQLQNVRYPMACKIFVPKTHSIAAVFGTVHYWSITYAIRIQIFEFWFFKKIIRENL